MLTGHDNGLITIAIAEADDAERERRRTDARALPHAARTFPPRGRSLFLGRAGARCGKLVPFREVFGDDTQDYDAALATPLRERGARRLAETFVSAYATSHPWEDFAETWAHYLHIVDTLEMAAAFGVRVQPRLAREETLSAEIDLDPYQTGSMQEIIDAWLPLTFAMNSLNRSMGSATSTRSSSHPGDRQARLHPRGRPRQVIEAGAMRPLRADVAIPFTRTLADPSTPCARPRFKA